MLNYNNYIMMIDIIYKCSLMMMRPRNCNSKCLSHGPLPSNLIDFITISLIIEVDEEHRNTLD